MCESDLISRKVKSKKFCLLPTERIALLETRLFFMHLQKSYTGCSLILKVCLSKTISSWKFSHEKHTAAVIEKCCHQSFFLSGGATCESLKLIPPTDHNI